MVYGTVVSDDNFMALYACQKWRDFDIPNTSIF